MTDLTKGAVLAPSDAVIGAPATAMWDVVHTDGKAVRHELSAWPVIRARNTEEDRSNG